MPEREEEGEGGMGERERDPVWKGKGVSYVVIAGSRKQERLKGRRVGD